MIEIGKVNRLKIVRTDNKWIYFDGGDLGEILLDRREVAKDCKVEDSLEVFIYPDSEKKIIATMQKPLGMVGQFAWLKVVSVDTVGTFMDWGLRKDLMVPYSEQKLKMKEDRSYPVFIYFDKISGRIVASAKLNKFFKDDPTGYKEGAKADLLVYGDTDVFYKVIVDNAFRGVLYKNEVFQRLYMGQKMKGYIKKVREDGKLDLLFHKPGYTKVNGLAKTIVERIEKEGGFLAVTDKSSPESIYRLFGESKSTFKNALGLLYKKRLIVIEKDGIKLREE